MVNGHVLERSMERDTNRYLVCNWRWDHHRNNADLSKGWGESADLMRTHFLWINVLMLNPRVGLIFEMFSPLIFFRMVVLPALSRPLPQP